MGFNIAKLNCCVLAALALAAAYAAKAQNAGQGSEQPILFSAPDDDGATSNMPTLTAKSSALLNFANTVQSPGVNLRAGSQSQLPPPAPAVSPGQAQQMRRLLDERKNWALLTPEQILGLPTQKKILGVSDRDPLAQPDSGSVLAQFFDRLEQSHMPTNNTDSSMTQTTPLPGVLASPASPTTPGLWSSAGASPASPSLISQFLNPAANNSANSVQAASGGRPKPIKQSAPAFKTAFPQPNTLATFQQLLQLQSPASDDAGASGLGGSSLRPIFPASVSPAAAIAATPASVPLPVISIGATYSPLNSMAVAPAMATPLPGPFGQTNLAPVTTPAWKPQAPPWESSAPELGKVPQRKF